jgi:hypothetical protein
LAAKTRAGVTSMARWMAAWISSGFMRGRYGSTQEGARRPRVIVAGPGRRGSGRPRSGVAPPVDTTRGSRARFIVRRSSRSRSSGTIRTRTTQRGRTSRGGDVRRMMAAARGLVVIACASLVPSSPTLVSSGFIDLPARPSIAPDRSRGTHEGVSRLRRVREVSARICRFCRCQVPEQPTSNAVGLAVAGGVSAEHRSRRA